MGGRYPPPGLAPEETACTQNGVTIAAKKAAPRKKGRKPIASQTGPRARASSPGRAFTTNRAIGAPPCTSSKLTARPFPRSPNRISSVEIQMLAAVPDHDLPGAAVGVEVEAPGLGHAVLEADLQVLPHHHRAALEDEGAALARLLPPLHRLALARREGLPGKDLFSFGVASPLVGVPVLLG